MKIFWTNEKIHEWRQHLGYVSSHLAKKAFANSTQYYPGVMYEREVMPKKYAVEIFPALSDSLRGVHRNKETFSVDVVENTYAGEKRWGLVFYGVTSKLLAYYSLGSKDPTAALTLDALGKFIDEHVIPTMIITDFTGMLGAGNKWQHFLGRLFVPLNLSESDKHNQNPVECAIHKLRDGLSKIRNACGVGVLAYHWEAMEYLFSINNYVARASLGNRFSFESFWGETPDISMIRFKFCEPVYYRNWNETAGKVRMHTVGKTLAGYNRGRPLPVLPRMGRPLPVLPRIRPRLPRGTQRVTHDGMPRQTSTSTRAI